MFNLRTKIKTILEQETERWPTIEEQEVAGQYVLDRYKDKFTVDYFIERIPFLKDYNVIIQPGNSPYDGRTNGMQYRIEMGFRKSIENKELNIGETYVNFDKIFVFSDFFFLPTKNSSTVFYSFGLKNRVVIDSKKTNNPELDMKTAIFKQAILLVSEKLSYHGEIMINGLKRKMMKKGQMEFNDPDIFPESELDNIINEINKTLFNFEEFVSNLGVEIKR
jgi:hypothetical protein